MVKNETQNSFRDLTQRKIDVLSKWQNRILSDYEGPIDRGQLPQLKATLVEIKNRTVPKLRKDNWTTKSDELERAVIRLQGYIKNNPKGQAFEYKMKVIRIIGILQTVLNALPDINNDVDTGNIIKDSKNNSFKAFPTFPFKSNLKKADDYLIFGKDHTESEIIQRAGGGVRLPLSESDLKKLDDIVGSRELSKIENFLIQKCNVQNIENLSWKKILSHINFWQENHSSNTKEIVSVTFYQEEVLRAYSNFYPVKPTLDDLEGSKRLSRNTIIAAQKKLRELGLLQKQGRSTVLSAKGLDYCRDNKLLKQ